MLRLTGITLLSLELTTNEEKHPIIMESRVGLCRKINTHTIASSAALSIYKHGADIYVSRDWTGTLLHCRARPTATPVLHFSCPFSA